MHCSLCQDLKFVGKAVKYFCRNVELIYDSFLKLLADFTVSSNATRVVVITYSSVDRVLRQVDHITPIPKAPCTNDIKTVLMMHGNRRKYRYRFCGR